MTRRITVVCRHNQARSVIAAAALKRHFPDLHVSSAGIAAVDGQRIPQSILNLADVWGIDVLDLVSHSVDAVQEGLIASDYVVVAEDDFVSYLTELGVAPQKILSMQDQRFDHALIPFDPIGQGDRVLSVELAKAILTTMQLIRAENGFGRNNAVEAIFTIDEVDFQSQLESAWSRARHEGSVLLVSDFRAPNFKAISQVCDYVLELHLNRTNRTVSLLDSEGEGALERALASQRSFAISGRFELDQAERFILSAEFTGLVSRLANNSPVLVLTEPRGLGPYAFLAASVANY